MKVLLSIKPEFADKIFSGEKKFEFRRVIFKNKAVSTVVVYVSSPVQKVVGEFEIGSIITDGISALWEQTKEHAGISGEFFQAYFSDKREGHAIVIKKVTRYKKPLCLRKDFDLLPPQSFMYLS